MQINTKWVKIKYMKKILIITALILISSGCTKVQETKTELAQQQCPSCEEYCKEHPVVKEPETPEPAKHPIDIEEERCLKKAYSNADMRNCTYDAMDAWFEVIEKDLATLKKILSSEKYEAIVKSQKQWKKYQEEEFETNNLVVLNKGGTFYHVVSVGDKAHIVKERALLLNSYVNLYSEQD